MIAQGRCLSFVFALTALALFVIMETSVASSYSVHGFDTQSNGKDVDGEEVQYGFDGKKKESDFEKRKLIRIPLLPGRYQGRDRRSIDTVDETINEYERNGGYGSKFERNATTPGDRTFRASDISAIGLKGTKKNHKKLKLAQMQSKNSKIKENWRDQDSGKYIDEHSLKKSNKRHVDYNTGRQESIIGNTKQLRDADYYARRKAVMENYYARQREIAKKYAERGSTTTTPINRYNLLAKINSNNVSSPVNVARKYMRKEENVVNYRHNGLDANSYVSSTTKSPKRIRDTKMNSPEDGNDNAEDSEYYDEYEDEAETTQSGHTTTQSPIIRSTRSTWSTSAYPTRPINNEAVLAATGGDRRVLLRGNCHPGTLIYQQNLFFNVHRKSEVETDVNVSIDGFCIACVRVESDNAIKSTLSFATISGSNGGVNTLKLKAVGAQDERLSLVLKIFFIRKTGDHCAAI